MNLQYDGYVFDCDGTLVDSMPGHYVAWIDTFSKYGIEFPEKRFYELGGVPTEKIVKMFAEENGVEIDIAEFTKEKDRATKLAIAHMKPFEAVVQVADQVRKHRPVAVATGSSQEIATLELEQIGILHWFDTVVAAEDVENHKPSPDVYLEAAKRLNVSPQKCCAYEDTDLGLQAARSAGMAVVDVRTM